MRDIVTIKLMSLAVHAEEYLETGEPTDAQAVWSLLGDPDIVAVRAELDAMALLPVKRSEE